MYLPGGDTSIDFAHRDADREHKNGRSSKRSYTLPTQAVRSPVRPDVRLLRAASRKEVSVLNDIL